MLFCGYLIVRLVNSFVFVLVSAVLKAFGAMEGCKVCMDNFCALVGEVFWWSFYSRCSQLNNCNEMQPSVRYLHIGMRVKWYAKVVLISDFHCLYEK